MKTESSLPINNTEYKTGQEGLKKRLIIDIGTGGFSYFNDIKETVDTSKFYAAIDLSRKVKSSGQEAEMAGMEAGAVIADAQKLPFGDGQASDVVLSDILNSPLLQYKHDQKKVSGEINSAPPPNEQQKKSYRIFPMKKKNEFLLLPTISHKKRSGFWLPKAGC
jgi:hypothetical protein